ncbi:MAG TPA: hypothetical protein VFZ57_11465 [Thermoanaerobaculia bacterium]|nr:hypothetical protein [Thermoanaerobaculia bacterium]
MSRKKARGFPRRAGGVFLWTLAVLYASYLIAANILLHTSILERKLDKAFAGSIVGVHVTHGAAWSFFPGHMWVRNATVRCYNYDVEWILQVDDHVAWLNPVALAWRSVRVIRSRGRGVRFRLRFRRDRDAPLGAAAAWIPPIDDLPDPPVHPNVPRPPPTGPHDVVWSMVFNRLDMEDVREIWIEKYHWIDSGRTRGRFSMTPGRSLSVALQMEMRSGEILVGDEVALEGATGHLELAIAPMKLDAAEPTPLIPNLSAGGQVLARITSPRLFAPLLDSGTMDARVALAGNIRAGVISDGTIADLSIAKADVRGGEWNVATLGELSICVRQAAGGGKPSELVASAVLDHLDARQAGPPTSDAITVRGAHLVANLVSPWVDVGKPFDPGEGRLRLDAKTASFRLKDLTVHGSVSSQLRVAPRRSPASAAGTARTGESAASGAYHLDGSYVEVHNASVRRKGQEGGQESSDSGWWGRVDLPALEFRPATPAVRARFVTRLRDAKLPLTVVDRFVAFPVSFLKLLTSGEVEARATIRAQPGAFALDGLDAADGDKFHSKGWLHRDRATKRGAFLVEIGKTALGIHVTTAKTELVIKSPREWFAGVSEAGAK